MENRVWNQEVGRRINTKQNTDTNRGRGDIGEQKIIKDVILGLVNIAVQGAGQALGTKVGKTGFQ